jgi:hypothetical protein
MLIEGSTNHNRRGKPDAGRDEAECLCGFPPTTRVVVDNSTPCPDTAAVQLVNSIDENTKGGKPGERDYDINCWKLSAIVSNLVVTKILGPHTGP